MSPEEGRAPSTASEKSEAPSPSPQSERSSWSSSPSHSGYSSRLNRKQHPEHLRRTSTASGKTHTHTNESRSLRFVLVLSDEIILLLKWFYEGFIEVFLCDCFGLKGRFWLLQWLFYLHTLDKYDLTKMDDLSSVLP